MKDWTIKLVQFVGVGWCLWGGRVKERDQGEGVWLVDFVYLYEKEQ
jgi:hypothetical protein